MLPVRVAQVELNGRSGIIACHYRAAEWRHNEVELAAHHLLQLIDKTSG